MPKHKVPALDSVYNRGMSRNPETPQQGSNVIEIVDGELVDSYMQRFIDQLIKQDQEEAKQKLVSGACGQLAVSHVA